MILLPYSAPAFGVTKCLGLSSSEITIWNEILDISDNCCNCSKIWTMRFFFPFRKAAKLCRKNGKQCGSWWNCFTSGRYWVYTVCLAITELPHYKTNKMAVRPAKTQISLGIRPVWSVFAMRSVGSKGPKLSSCGQQSLVECPGWSESSLGAKIIVFVLSWGGSYKF